MSLNMKTLTQALAKTAAVIEKTVSTTVQEVTGPRPLQDYDLLDQIGSGGPGLAWRLYAGRPRPSAPSTQYPLVCVWILDKRAIADARTRAGLSRAAEDAFLDVIRADAARLVRLRHPGVVHVVQALEETKNAMAMVTEPLFASVANTLGNVENVAKVPNDLKGMKMGLLEVKHGLLQIAESLDFLYNNAHLIHRAISPETVFITSTGAWKLGGFGFAISVDQASGASPSTQPFHYSEYDVEDSILPLQPSLNYTAPEWVRSKTETTGRSADIFSFGCLAYHLIAHKPLLDCHNNVKMYMNSLTYLSSDAFSAIPSELTGDLQSMLSMDENSRPTALDFTGSSFFRNDTRLRALRFLDHMLERDNMQKTEFLKALSDMWKDFDSRILRYKVLPPLCAELRNLVMQPMILPMVLTIAESQDKNDFEVSTLPALVPVLSSATGETLLLLVKHADLIISKASPEHLLSHVLPLLVRAYDDTDPRIQEEVLRRTVPLARQLDMQLIKQAILPRVHGLALKTTVAAVRVNALRCLGDLISSLDKNAILEILQTLKRCTDVDHSAPTLMCTLGVASSIYKQHGLEFSAEHVLPLLFPLLIAQQLNMQQFAKYMLFVKDILRKIEEKRGVTVNDSGTPEVKLPLTNGLHPEPSQTSGQPLSTTKRSSSWDEDWVPLSKGTAIPSNTEINPESRQIAGSSHPVLVSSAPTQYLSTNSQQYSSSCTPVGSVSSLSSTSIGLNTQLGVSSTQNQNSSGLSDSSFDDIDPFANWPPKPSNRTTFVGSANKPVHSLGISSSSSINLGSATNPTSIDISKLYDGGLGPNTRSQIGVDNNISGISNIGNLGTRSDSSNFVMGAGYNAKGPSVDHYARKGEADIGSIFNTLNSGQPAPRIAPPPTTVVGRGRSGARGRGSLAQASRSTIGSSKVTSDQTPLLDLL